MRTLVLGLALTLSGCAASHGPRAPRAAQNTSTHSTARVLGAEGWRCDGSALFAPLLPAAEHARRVAALDEARKQWDKAPEDPEALIWVGRRLGYLGRMREAIDVFGIGVERFPGDARMLRHRGHRYISVREFELARADLERAAKLVAGRADEVEPDGQPNAAGVPLETLHSNIHYHLGLACFLLGDFAAAERGFRDALAAARNADNQCSSTHWLYLSLRKQGRHADAARAVEAVRPIRDVLEYRGYFELCRGYLGEMSLDEVFERAKSRGGVERGTCGFGAAMWWAFEGDAAGSTRLLRDVVQGDNPFAFGYIAAEVELANARDAGGAGNSARASR